MIALAGRIFERRCDVFSFEQRIIFEDFLAAGAGGQEIEHILHANAQAAQTGTPAGHAKFKVGSERALTSWRGA
jgi:hypothetical protein